MNVGRIMAEAFVDELSKMSEDNETAARRLEQDRARYLNSGRQKKIIRDMATADLSALSPSAKEFVAKAKAAGKSPLEYSRSEQRAKLNAKVWDRVDEIKGNDSRGAKKLVKKLLKTPGTTKKIKANPDPSGKFLEQSRYKEKVSRSWPKKVSEAARSSE